MAAATAAAKEAAEEYRSAQFSPQKTKLKLNFKISALGADPE